MKAITLIKNGHPDTAFEMREHPEPTPTEGQVLIRVEASGLNFADVMARNGMYRDAPPIPSIVGYEVVGKIEKLGSGVTGFEVGQRVVGLTRFGGYAELAVTDERAIAAIPDDMDKGVAAALATQYCTAWYAACEATNLFEGEKVLIHAAAGGVGTALTQIAKYRGCEIFGTAGSDEKLDFLKKNGVDHAINYRKTDFVDEVKKVLKDDRLDVAFDSIGGKTYSLSGKLLGSGGRLISYGAASRSGAKGGIFSTLKLVWDFGIYHPVGLISSSQSKIGVNMLRLADNQPQVIQRCMHKVVELANQGILKPHVGGVFPASEMNKAHALLESRKSIGKIIVEW